MTEEPRVLTDKELEEAYGPWDAYEPDRVVEIMTGFTGPWWIAGGWAIELHLGGPPLREHEDVDVLVLRRDASVIQRDLAGWDLHLADSENGVRAWEPGVPIPRDVGDIWIRESDGGPWRFQLMLNPTEGENWVFKRDQSLQLRISEIGLRAEGGIPYLRPEIQLLNKGTGSLGIRDKDEADFRAALPALEVDARQWLGMGLRRVRDDHPWLDAL